MDSIQKIIVERVQLYIRREIKKHLRLRDEETRRMEGDLADCKRRLSKLEKIVEEKDDEIIVRWVTQMRANGATLKALRKKLGISQTDLSILLNSNPATINRWESGKVKLSQKSCEKIAKIHALNASEAHHILQEKRTLYKENLNNGI